MTVTRRVLAVLIPGAIVLGMSVTSPGAPAPNKPSVKLEESRLFIEFNATDNDLGFHVFLDGEEWREISITNPSGKVIFEVEGRGPYARLGLSELAVEGAEPTLDEVPLEKLLAMFPEGRYKFAGTTADGSRITGSSEFKHAIPAAPSVSTEVFGDTVIIKWDPVTGPPDGFPNEPIDIVGYEVIVDPFDVVVPADVFQMTLPKEFVDSLAPGEYHFEVLAVEKGHNQTITESTFTLE